MDIQPITLTGRVIRLEPATAAHAAGLAKYGEPDIFAYSFPPPTFDEAGFAALIATIEQRANMQYFAIVHQETGEAIGATSYMDIQPHNRWLEIGSTWIGKPFQGTAVNPEMKYMLLRHAFEEQDAVRVQLKTDKRNTQSQRAIEKLGAKKEGILRQHIIMSDGYIRDTVMYSILPDEWHNEVKPKLEARLGYVP